MKWPLKVPAVRYAVQPPTTTATSCLSSRRTATNNETKTTATPTQSPTAGQNTLSSEKSPVTGRPSRKHVQFPDTASDSQKGKPGKWTRVFPCIHIPVLDSILYYSILFYTILFYIYCIGFIVSEKLDRVRFKDKRLYIQTNVSLFV